MLQCNSNLQKEIIKGVLTMTSCEEITLTESQDMSKQLTNGSVLDIFNTGEKMVLKIQI